MQAEVFVLCGDTGVIELTGPCGSAAWYLEVGAAEHPVDVVTRIVSDTVGSPRVVHSTSWRRDRDAVVLSFVVVIDAGQVGAMHHQPVARAALARSQARAAPRSIATLQVLEHALRHLAWLTADDPVVRESLSGPFKQALAAYEPEPFRNLG